MINLPFSGAVVANATHRSSVNREMSKGELRKKHQAELARRKNEETARRLAGNCGSSGKPPANRSEVVAYKNVNDMPNQVRKIMIQVDQGNESILVPINETMVPFHVSHIKNVTYHQETSTLSCYIRIIFNLVPDHDKNSIKLKEFSFRSKDPKHIKEIVSQIKTLRRQVANRVLGEAEKDTLVEQENLKLSESISLPVKLDGLLIRPVFGGRGGRNRTGSLEAHENGFRFSTSKADERVDVMFGNIKHAFFQPSENEMITLLHFHLHSHITVGNKKTKDVQFYVEVSDVDQTLHGGPRYDVDEVEKERREMERRRKINMDFQNFVNKAKLKLKSSGVEFERPLRDRGFDGVPHKSSVFMVPTSSCLVQLIEPPFVVVTLDEIEIVSLERVGLGTKTFDMKIVFKDFKRDVLRIDTIFTSVLDDIEEWLDKTGLKYYESRLNLNWRSILKTIMDKPDEFIEDGGWEFLNMQASDSDSDRDSDDDSDDAGYVPSESEPESESESEDDVSEEDDDDEEEEDSDEEEGKTLEEWGMEADREENDEGRKRKFMKVRAAPGSCKRPRFW